MSSEEFVTSESWLIELVGAYATEVRARSLVVHSELDPHFQMRCDPLLEAALERLFRLVFATLPNGCEFYLASARTIAPVTTLGSGTLTLRWQVAGDAGRPTRGEASVIRPITGGAAFHAQSDAVAELERAFSDAGWTIELEATNGDRELWARASRR